MAGEGTVNISPGIGILAILSNVNYKPWFALAEYVDNSVQSAIDFRDQLLEADGENYLLRMSIDVDVGEGGSITIRDNAAGIARSDFPRAFRPAALPPNRSGLSEFGMGMKSASCWFAPRWTVRTTSIGDTRIYTVPFDIEKIIEDQLDELEIIVDETPASTHFTEIVLTDLYRKPVGRTLGKIRQHLSDIYRHLIRTGQLELRFNGEILTYTTPKILVAPYYRTPDAAPVQWRRSIEFDFGSGLSVRGFVAIRDTGSTTNSGFSLFRRGRVIEGSGDEGYRPHSIFGASNKFRSQRLFGELHLDGFAVTHTKDGFLWDENEEVFLELLKEELDDQNFPLLKQAEGYRKFEPAAKQGTSVREALTNTGDAIQRGIGSALADVIASPNEEPKPPSGSAPSNLSRLVSVDLEGTHWDVRMEVVDEPASMSLMTRNINMETSGRVEIHLRLNSANPFMVRFAQSDSDALELTLRFAAAIVIGEATALMAGIRQAGVVVRNIDRVLSVGLSTP